MGAPSFAALWRRACPERSRRVGGILIAQWAFPSRRWHQSVRSPTRSGRLLPPKLPRQRPRNRNRMRHQNSDLSQYAWRFVEDAELPQHCPAVVVDFFSGQTVIGVEGVDTAKWEIHPSASRRETAPGAELRSANHDFEDDGVVGDVATLDLDL